MAVAVWLRVPLKPMLGDRVPFMLLFTALLPLVLLVRPAPFLVAAIVGLVGTALTFRDRFFAGGLAGLLELLLFGIAALTAAVTAGLAERIRRRHEHELAERDARLAAEAAALQRLTDASAKLWHIRDLTEGLFEILDATIALLGADKGNIQLLDEPKGVLVIAAQRGFDREFLEFFQEVRADDDSACGQALRLRRRIIVEDVETDPAFVPVRVARAEGFRAVQSTPLIHQDGKVVGMISTHFRDAHRPSEQDLRRLDLYARRAVDFIERLRSDTALREANRNKERFLAILAHELRNPLAPIVTSMHLLDASADGASPPAGARAAIRRQVDHLVRLVDDLLDVSRVNHDKLELRIEATQVGPVIRRSVENCDASIEQSAHDIIVELPDEPLWVDADPVRLEQVVSNLLSNACKYTPPGGRVQVSAERQGSDVLIRVRDNGIGIPSDKLTSVFEMFAQVGHTLERAQGGLGIGLHLARRLVELHGGNIEARSDGEGKGSEFIVRLPLRTGIAPPREENVVRSQSATLAVPLSILVVDDNHDAADSLADLLALDGHQTDIAYDGEAALEKFRQTRPQVVLLDLGLPKLNGYDVCRAIRRDERGHPVVIALTGWGQNEDRKRTKEAGFDAHLVKPVDPGMLRAMLASLPVGEQAGAD